MKTNVLLIIGSILFCMNSMASLNDTVSNQGKIKIELLEIIHPTCQNSNDGSIKIKITGGKGPYRINWNSTPNQQSFHATNLSAGVYFVDVEDAEGNKTFNSFTLSMKEEVEFDNLFESICYKTPVDNLKNVSTFTFLVNNIEMNWSDIQDLNYGLYVVTIIKSTTCKSEKIIPVYFKNGINEVSSVKN